MSEYHPAEVILAHLRHAERLRLRIVHWRINSAAWLEITRMRNAFMHGGEKMGCELMGIPFELVRDGAENPSIVPVHETHGGKLLMHDYDGPLLHGKELERFHQAIIAQTPSGQRNKA